MKKQSNCQECHQITQQQYIYQPTTISSPEQSNTSKPISSHFKQFLLQHSWLSRKTQQNYCLDKFTRTGFNHSVKKNTIYRKILNTSINKDNLRQDLTKYREVFQSKKNELKNMYSFAFREIWENQQRKQFQKDLSSKGNSNFTIIESPQRGKSQETKTFEHFLETKKKHDRGRSWQQTDQDTIQLNFERKNSISLSIAGNHQQIKQKPAFIKTNDKNKEAKVRNIKNHKAAGAVENVQNNLQKQQLKQAEETNGIQAKNHKPQEIKKYQCKQEVQIVKKQSNQAKFLQSRSVKQKRYQHCYKNFFSPFNGIQIKYLSSQNQDSLVNMKKGSFKRPIQPFRLMRPSYGRVLKKNESPIIDKRSIVFRSKSTTKDYQPPCIDGWKVQQEHNQQFNDFYQKQ